MKSTTARRATPAPAPCAITRFDAEGNIVAQEEVIRARIRIDTGYTPDNATYRFRVMATEETGEECFVDYATSRTDGDRIAEYHLLAHPEHRAAWVERL